MEAAAVLLLVLSYTLMACTQMVESSKTIFILGGQSNMAGQGGVTSFENKTYVWDGVIPPECQPNPQIFRLNFGLSWEEAHEPISKDRNQTCGICGIGPGMPFGNSLLKRLPSIGEIGLVPCAIRGSYISHWMRGTENYNNLLNRTRAALAKSGGGAIRAFLWYQGESDTVNQSLAEAYKTKLVRFLTDLRTDLHLPTLPVFQVALASAKNFSNIEIVREAQLQIWLPNVTTVDAKGLKLMPDNLHLTTPSQVRLGTMLAHAFLQSLPPS